MVTRDSHPTELRAAMDDFCSGIDERELSLNIANVLMNLADIYNVIGPDHEHYEINKEIWNREVGKDMQLLKSLGLFIFHGDSPPLTWRAYLLGACYYLVKVENALDKLLSDVNNREILIGKSIEYRQSSGILIRSLEDIIDRLPY